MRQNIPPGLIDKLGILLLHHAWLMIVKRKSLSCGLKIDNWSLRIMKNQKRNQDGQRQLLVRHLFHTIAGRQKRRRKSSHTNSFKTTFHQYLQDMHIVIQTKMILINGGKVLKIISTSVSLTKVGWLSPKIWSLLTKSDVDGMLNQLCRTETCHSQWCGLDPGTNGNMMESYIHMNRTNLIGVVMLLEMKSLAQILPLLNSQSACFNKRWNQYQVSHVNMIDKCSYLNELLDTNI